MDGVFLHGTPGTSLFTLDVQHFFQGNGYVDLDLICYQCSTSIYKKRTYLNHNTGDRLYFIISNICSAHDLYFFTCANLQQLIPQLSSQAGFNSRY